MSLFTINIHNHVDIETILAKLDFIILKQTTMSELGQEIKTQLAAAIEKVNSISGDVTRLHTKIEALSLNPSPEEVQEIKQMSTDLNNKLQVVDEATPLDETPPPQETKGKTIRG